MFILKGCLSREQIKLYSILLYSILVSFSKVNIQRRFELQLTPVLDLRVGNAIRRT